VYIPIYSYNSKEFRQFHQLDQKLLIEHLLCANHFLELNKTKMYNEEKDKSENVIIKY
jgi:hypothetical protein